MRDIIVFPYDDAPVTVERLSGALKPTQSGRLVDMDEVTSYQIDVAHAEVRMSAASLSALLNRYVLPSAGTAIQNVTVRFDNGEIHLRGTLKKAGLPIGFSATALASPTPSGELRLEVTKMKAAGFIPKPLLDALGLTLAKVARPKRPGIFRIEADTMFLPVASMFPPPKFYGKVKSIRISPQVLDAVFEGPEVGQPPPMRLPCYMIFHGGRVGFGKLTMTDSDLALLPRKRSATLGFSPTHYFQQLVAGYSLSKPDRGLISYVGDYRDLKRQ